MPTDYHTIIYLIVGLLIGVILHEYMHGRAADHFGDHTARAAGRLTLNPVPHIDPFGTVIMPLALLLITRGSWMFGYAKPVPVNPFFMKKPRRDMVFVSLAGPATNLAIAAVVLVVGLIVHSAGVASSQIVVETSGGLSRNMTQLFILLFTIAEINIILCFFNLIPIPPLDGSHVVEFFMSHETRLTYERVAPFGFVIILVLFYLAGSYFIKALSPIFNLMMAAWGTGLRF
jgi:Zn-dependent protease